MAEEKLIWSGTPSQVVNIPTFLLGGLFFWLVVPLFIILWQWLVIKMTKYELTTERLRTQHGVINKKMDELELYRVRDYKLDQPIWLRIFSLGNILLQTSDVSHPAIKIRAIPDSEKVREQIRTYVEACRVRKGVRDVDVS
jgi:uncharacterized membrane protein YdbT with pleckstrin-like domain